MFLIIQGRYGKKILDVSEKTNTEILQLSADNAFGFHCDFDSAYLAEIDEEGNETQITDNILYTGHNCDNGATLDDDTGRYYDKYVFESYEEAKEAGETYEDEDEMLYHYTITDPSGCSLNAII